MGWLVDDGLVCSFQFVAFNLLLSACSLWFGFWMSLWLMVCGLWFIIYGLAFDLVSGLTCCFQFVAYGLAMI